MASLKAGKNKASGVFRAENAAYSVFGDYSFSLHDKLVSMNSIDVLFFESENRFVAQNLPAKINIGTILIGSLDGTW